MKLIPHQVEKPWGRNSLPSAFGDTGGKRVGEIWFETPDCGDDLPLLAKYIFTSEKLSIQVHPNDTQARARGLPRGKFECWYILSADPGATLGLGLKSSVPADELRQAALDGSIEQLIDWRPVEAGEFYIIPPGTVHAIGAGISLLEFQQNAAITYRLYDYGRPRELHLDDGVAVAARAQFPEDCARPAEAPTDAVLLNGPLFSLVRASSAHSISASLGGTRRWVMPIEGTVTSGNETASTGECLLLDAGAALKFEAQAIALIGVEGRVCSRAADSNSRTPSEAALSATRDVETRSLGTGTGTGPQRKLDP